MSKYSRIKFINFLVILLNTIVVLSIAYYFLQNNFVSLYAAEKFTHYSSDINSKIYPDSINSNFFPLKIGNKFKYVYIRTWSGPGGGGKDSIIKNLSIIDTITKRGHKYYISNGLDYILPKYLRIDSITKSLYTYDSLNSCSKYYYEKLVDSLSLISGFEFDCNQIIRFNVISYNYELLFNYYSRVLGLYNLELGRIHTYRYYSKIFGFNYYKYESFSGLGGTVITYKLIGCIIDNIAYGDTTGITVNTSSNTNNVPVQISLKQNYPNPFNPVTKIEYDVVNFNNKPVFVELKIYDITGKEIEFLINKYQNTGSYIVDFNGINLNSGIYFYKLTAGNFTLTKKMLLIK